MDAKDLREAINKMYSRLNYREFCEYMGFNAKYDDKYWATFQDLADAFSKFDDARLQKMIDFGKESAETYGKR